MKLNLLVGYLIISNLVIAMLLFSSFSISERKETMDELTVKRINIVDESGENLRLVLSNETRQDMGYIDGEELPKRERPAGLIFFNSQGDECGGIIYDGNEGQAGFVLSVDQYKDDQVMQLQYMEDTQNHKRKYGLQLWDFPKENTFKERTNRFKEMQTLKNKEDRKRAYDKIVSDSLISQNRLFVGKTFDKEVGLFINDKNGIPRIKIYIDEEDTPRIETLNAEGKIIN